MEKNMHQRNNGLVTRAISLAMAAVLMSACQAKLPTLTEKEAKNMQTLTQKMTTRCVGRYLIDMPEDIVLNSQGGEKIEEVMIDINPMTETTFMSMLENRKLELESERTVGKSKVPTLKDVKPIEGTKGFVFDRAESPVSNVFRVLELLAWRNGYFIKMTSNAIDMSFSKEINGTDREISTPEKLAQLLNVFHRTKGRADHEIPTAQGVCIRNGFISGPPTEQEDVASIYHLKTADDVYFVFETDSAVAERNSLLDRDKDLAPVIAAGGGHVLRKGHRESQDVKELKYLQEYLYAILDDPNTDRVRVLMNTFIFESNSRIGSAKTPVITINLHNGTRKPERARRYDEEFPPLIYKATLSEAEAVALWDTVIPTVRPRPGAF